MNEVWKSLHVDGNAGQGNAWTQKYCLTGQSKGHAISLLCQCLLSSFFSSTTTGIIRVTFQVRFVNHFPFQHFPVENF